MSARDDGALRPALYWQSLPAEIISYVVLLYFRFPLSRRMVEELLAARDTSVTYEMIRQ
jgi:transposase-like protein